MGHNQEQAFFDEAGIYVSQRRFVTREGDTYTTGALQRSFLSEEREGSWRTTLMTVLCGCIALAGIITFGFCVRRLIFIGARIGASAGIESALDEVERQTGERVGEEIVAFINPDKTWNDYIGLMVVTALGLLAIIIGTIGAIRAIQKRRRRYIAVFMFGPGGVDGQSNRQEHVIRDYDGEMLRRLIAAANRAKIAAQPP